jgi:hypothetical protein
MVGSAPRLKDIKPSPTFAEFPRALSRAAWCGGVEKMIAELLRSYEKIRRVESPIQSRKDSKFVVFSSCPAKSVDSLAPITMKPGCDRGHTNG